MREDLFGLREPQANRAVSVGPLRNSRAKESDDGPEPLYDSRFLRNIAGAKSDKNFTGIRD